MNEKAGKFLKRQMELYALAKAIEKCGAKAGELDIYMGNGGIIASMLNGIAQEVREIISKEAEL
jgi:hypothetical protein